MNATIPAAAHCGQCDTERRVTGPLGPGDGRRHLCLAICGHVVPNEAWR